MCVSSAFKPFSLVLLLLLSIYFAPLDSAHAKVIIDEPSAASVETIYSRSFGKPPKAFELPCYLRVGVALVLLAIISFSMRRRKTDSGPPESAPDERCESKPVVAHGLVKKDETPSVIATAAVEEPAEIPTGKADLIKTDNVYYLHLQRTATKRPAAPSKPSGSDDNFLSGGFPD